MAVFDDALVPGDPIGRYRLIRRLGRGGMGEVWLARDPALDREVAIKLQHEQGEDDRRRALREGRALAAVAHPNVLPVFEVGSAGDRTYLVMEHVAGDDLREHLRRRTHTTAEIVALFGAAARGLAALHAAGLVHCDFKPDNVLVDTKSPTLRVLICDLGLVAGTESQATGSDDSHEIATMPGFGTPRYMPPEQHMGEVPTPRADQYAWCVALFEALRSRPPFRGDNEALLAAKRRGMPTETRAPESRIDAILRRGMMPEPADRWPDMHTMLRAIDGDARPRLAWLAAAPLVGLALLGYGMQMQPAPVAPAVDPPAAVSRSLDDDPSECFAQAVELHTDGDLEEAISIGEEAYQLALEHDDEDTAASAAARTFRWVSDVHGEREAQQWRVQAQGALARVPDDHPGWHDYDEGVFNIEFNAGRKHAAWPAVTTMLARAEAHPGQGDRALVVGLQFYGELAAMSGDLEGAHRLAPRVIAAAREAFGNDHQETAAALLAAALWATRVGAGEQALAYIDEARVLYARLMPPEHVRMIHFHIVESSAWEILGQNASAFASLASAREQQARWVPKSLALAAQLDGNMGVVARRLGDIELARRLQHAALITTEAEVGPDSPRTALRLHNLAVLEQDVGDCERARQYAQRADEIYAVSYAAEHPHRLMLERTIHCDRDVKH